MGQGVQGLGLGQGLLETPGMAPGSALARPTILRNQVAQLRGVLLQQQADSSLSDEMLAEELARRVQVEGELRSQLAAKTQEVQALSMQVEQLLVANDALGAENAARSERIGELEDVMSRLYYQLRSLSSQGPASSPLAHLAAAARASWCLDSPSGTSSLRSSAILDSLDLAPPCLSASLPGVEAGGLRQRAEHKALRMLHQVATQVARGSEYSSQLEASLQAAQARIISLEALSQQAEEAQLQQEQEEWEQGLVWEGDSPKGPPLASHPRHLQEWHLSQIAARDQVVQALGAQLAAAELAWQEAETAAQLHQRQVQDLQLQHTQWSVELQRLQAHAQQRHAADAQRIRELEAAHLHAMETASQLQMELSSQALATAQLQLQLTSLQAASHLAYGSAEEAKSAAALAHTQLQCFQQQQHHCHRPTPASKGMGTSQRESQQQLGHISHTCVSFGEGPGAWDAGRPVGYLDVPGGSSAKVFLGQAGQTPTPSSAAEQWLLGATTPEAQRPASQAGMLCSKFRSTSVKADAQGRGRVCGWVRRMRLRTVSRASPAGSLPSLGEAAAALGNTCAEPSYVAEEDGALGVYADTDTFHSGTGVRRLLASHKRHQVALPLAGQQAVALLVSTARRESTGSARSCHPGLQYVVLHRRVLR
ncbi:hypothetical protein V8C86DRAFT_2522262 [Haematococcus lacustris]